ncbi:SDR family NAD(P)-dependent oxidoreductase, partial [Clostridium perfringens]
IYGYEVNVTDREGIKIFFNSVIEKFGKVDILVNNAGITRDALIQKMTEEMWDLVIDVNLKGLFNIAQLAGPHMMETGKGSIINIASVVGEFGNVGQTNYAATKAGVIGITKTWAKEFARKGANVRVNSVA